jgi:branched-chain amino acid aminotransferase
LKDKGIPVSDRVITIDEVVEADKRGTLQEIFGAGTAAVVSHVAELQYGDRTIRLPPIEDRKIGPMLKRHIDGLRVGKVEDTHGWLLRV